MSQIYGRCQQAVGAPRAMMIREFLRGWVQPLDEAIRRHQEEVIRGEEMQRIRKEEVPNQDRRAAEEHAPAGDGSGVLLPHLQVLASDQDPAKVKG